MIDAPDPETRRDVDDRRHGLRDIARHRVHAVSVEPEAPHILEGPSRQFRGYVELARGLRDEALDDIRRALELAREGEPDPALLIPALIRSAWVNLQVGRDSEARTAFAEALPLLREHPNATPWTLPEVALELGETAAVHEIVSKLPPSPGGKAVVAMLDREFDVASKARRFSPRAPEHG